MLACVDTRQVLLLAASIAGAIITVLLSVGSGVRVEYKDFRLSRQGRLSPQVRRTSRRGAFIAIIITVVFAVLFFYDKSHNYEPVTQSLLPLYDPGRSNDACGHLSPRANVAFQGRGPFVEGFLQCRHQDQASLIPTRYEFELPSDLKEGSRITGLDGTFFIDEAGNAKQTQAQAQVIWAVLYDDTLLCPQIHVRFGQTGHCQVHQKVVVHKNRTIEISERVLRKSPEHTLFAGIYLPVLLLERPC